MPARFKRKTERWSKLGYSRSCVEPIDGKWEAWSEGYKHIDGFYVNGEEHGIWVLYNSDGLVFKKVEYDSGNVVGSKIINSGVK